ncbi:hypothetical protein BJ973_005888 [Actinoplanes tereljensis]|uniref:hypothetical protein n=1 Tax=Paractinoplanes tereljensis TaxID=571912 RepID=UPI0019406D2A|nr:hypothetical protein [Actinoplanes tereljensis]
MTDHPPLNVASPDCAKAFYAGLHPRCVRLHHAAGLADLRRVLARHRAAGLITLDLIGHSTRHHHLLRLGATPIDMLNPVVARFFRTLTLPPTIAAVRLLGCETAVSDAGRRTLRLLAHALRIPVYGTLAPLLKSHSNADGFDPAFRHLLVEAAALPTGAGRW